uniref:Uncharacterized protein n=1 Tax=Arundo donax TaxID=35708 RepID=A0A0A9AUD7_ARUDO
MRCARSCDPLQFCMPILVALHVCVFFLRELNRG